MKKKLDLLPYCYALATIACTFFVGRLLLWLAPDNTSPWASPLFILMNLLPMLLAFAFLRVSGEKASLWQCLKGAFSPREAWPAWAAAVAVPAVYYGVSALLGNVTVTGAPASAVLAYFPWTLLQGGLEEVGWRWYLQERLPVPKNRVGKLLVLSGIWFVWHFPIYAIPWITAGSSNYFLFYLMILGNTFTLGAVKTLSRGALPCILAHMLIDTMAVAMLVGSDVGKIAALAAVEILLSLLILALHRRRAAA